MNNLYEQNALEIAAQAEGEMLKLKEKKFYTQNDIVALNEKWKMRCVLYGILCSLVTVLVIHYWK